MNKKVMLLIVLVFCALFVGKVYALQITVDGDPSDWVPQASVATSLPIPGTTYPGSDIAEVFFTNDQNNFYWRIDTYGNPDWAANDGHIMQICMNTDNNINTGASSLGGCNVSPTEDFGFDYIIIIRANGTPTPAIETYVCPDCNIPGSLGHVASSGTVTEISVPLSDLNLSSCTSGADCTIPTIIYSLALDPAYNDWVPAPDETFTVAVPGPTAVSLDTFSADFGPISESAILLIIGLTAVSLYIFAKRSQKV